MRKLEEAATPAKLAWPGRKQDPAVGRCLLCSDERCKATFPLSQEEYSVSGGRGLVQDVNLGKKTAPSPSGRLVFISPILICLHERWWQNRSVLPRIEFHTGSEQKLSANLAIMQVCSTITSPACPYRKYVTDFI